MARSAKSDPIRNFKFQVTINARGGGSLDNYTKGLSQIGFAAMSGLSVQNEMVGYREGGMNTHPHKFVGQSDFAPVTFSRGVFANQDQMSKWQQFLHSWNQATGGSSSADNDYRCDILVKVFDHPVSSGSYLTPETTEGNVIQLGNARFGFKLFNCWPGAYSLSDLNAGDSGIIVQQLTVHHEGFVVGWDETQVSALSSIG
jgi:phage tail-like protein